MKIKFSMRLATSTLCVSLLIVALSQLSSASNDTTTTQATSEKATSPAATEVQQPQTTTTTTTTASTTTATNQSVTPPQATEQIASTSTSTTTTGTPAPTSTEPPTTATSPVPSVASASLIPTDQQQVRDLQEVKRIIQQHSEQRRIENRLAMNRPTLAPQVVDFAPDSAEAKAASATSQFGLNFLQNLPADIGENAVISPLSLQNLLSMIMLGSGDNSTTQLELAQVLGYTDSGLLRQNRLKPHEAMRSVFQSILAAIHLPVSQLTAGSLSSQDPTDLLNTNPAALNVTEQQQRPQMVGAHLQTNLKEGDIPLSGQLNFTLANLVLSAKDKIEMKPDYERELKTYYNVNVEQFSRGNNKNASDNAETELPLHERVNKWVRESTQNQIERLAEESDLSGEDLILVLLNAAHFKGRWLHTFNTKATHERTFYNGGSEQLANKGVKFMRQKGVFGYAEFGSAVAQGDQEAGQDGRTRASEDNETLLTEDVASTKQDSASSNADGSQQLSAPHIELSREEARRLELTSKLNCSALMLPFSLNEGQELSMVFLLPTKRDGIADLQAALDGPALNEVYRSLSEQQVQVEMPKFSLEASHDAKATLLKMGLKSALGEGTAGTNLDRMYTAISGGVPKVDKVIHKAKINVDESGAEAAAASMASIVLRNFIRPPTPVFVADHPFLFVIRHNRSNMPLFMGRVSSL